ncbi:MAG: hypothetical protein RL490_2487 [Pseudomonadota bacterium]|jgi:hypothetical protein
MSKLLRALPLSLLLLAGGCAYDYASGYAPDYPPGYDSGMGSGDYAQPGDLFGGQNVTSVAAFYEPLAQFGGWVDSRWGRAFRPNAPAGWRPYVNGRWGEDRLWISDDPWGWATDHYGRWGFDERLNAWVWVPGTEWAPSWVAWREAEGSDQMVGWSPVPPGVAYSFSVGFGTGWGYDNWNSWYAPGWVWVPSAYLYRPGFGGQIRPWSTGYNYWRGSRWNWNSGWQGRPGGWNGGHAGGWNGGGWNGGRPGRPTRPPGGWNNGRPGVGDAIGGSIAGRPPRPPGERPYGNWNSGNNGRPQGGWSGGNGGGRPQGGWSGGNGGGRPQGGWSGGGGRPQGSGRPGRPSASIGDAVGGNLTENRPPPAFQPPRQERPAAIEQPRFQPRPQPAERPAFQPRPERAERPQSRSETGMERPD